MKILIILSRMKSTLSVPQYNYTLPLGLGYISSVIRKAGYDVDCLNLNHKIGTIDYILKTELEKKRYDIVTTGNVWFGYLAIKEIIEATRNYSPQSKIIIGGSIITSDPETSMKTLKPDYGIIGEGEVTILELLDCIDKKTNPQMINGICYFVDEKLIKTKSREVIEDLDSLPYPDFDGFEYEKYLDEMYPNMVYFNNHFDYPRPYYILTARGCPLNCTFCYHTLGRRYRKRDIDKVMEELGWAIKKYKINIICINDDLLSIDKKRLSEFCDKIRGLISTFPWEIKWTCQLAVSSVDDEILKKMKESGCNIISYGFESYNQEVLRSMKKPITPEQIDNAIKITIKNRIAIQGNFIFGDVAETIDTAEETLDYWKENCKGQINLSFIQPYPGSEIFNHCLKVGIIKDKFEYMSIGSQKENFFNMTNRMSNPEINWLHTEIMRLRMSGYCKVVIPKNIKFTNKINRWNLEVECPFCKEVIEYKNYYFKVKTFHKDFMICRKCNMRFHIIKPM